MMTWWRAGPLEQTRQWPPHSAQRSKNGLTGGGQNSKSFTRRLVSPKQLVHMQLRIWIWGTLSNLEWTWEQTLEREWKCVEIGWNSLSWPAGFYSVPTTVRNYMWDPLAITLPKVAGNRCLAGSTEPVGSTELLVGPTGPTFGHWVLTVSVVVAQWIFVENFILVCSKKFIWRISSKFKKKS